MNFFFNYRLSRSLVKIGSTLIVILFFSCSNEDPSVVLKKDFISYITGNWEVDNYNYSNPNSPDTISIDIFRISSGSINTYGYQYIIPIDNDSSYIDSKEYDISDINFCKLSKVNKLQYWTIKLEDNILILYTSSHCAGYNERFEIISTNLESPNLDHVGSINADILLVNQNSEIELSNFVVYNRHIYEGTSFSFLIPSESEYFHFVKK